MGWSNVGSGLQTTRQTLDTGLTAGEDPTDLADKAGSECVGEKDASMHHSPSKDSFVQPLKIPKGNTAAARAKMRSAKVQQK